MDSSLHLVPGRYKLPTAPGRSLRKDGPGWEKAENKFTATSGLPACVCVLCRLHICACVVLFSWLPTAPGGPGGRTVQDGRNAEIKFTATSGLRVCLCVLCRHLYMHVCVRSQPEVSLVVVKREKESE